MCGNNPKKAPALVDASENKTQGERCDENPNHDNVETHENYGNTIFHNPLIRHARSPLLQQLGTCFRVLHYDARFYDECDRADRESYDAYRSDPCSTHKGS
jgi:hypothetical protein